MTSIDRRAIQSADTLLWLVLDTLRHDVARDQLRRGRTPNLAALLPPTGWEERHTPGNFTLPAHQAFFAGFLPTPTGPGPHPRRFATSFHGSESTTGDTWVFEDADIVTGLSRSGYRTVCIGGVGFFNGLSPLARVLPGLFQESHWSTEMGVTDPRSTEHQFRLASRILDETRDQPLFLFINVSAIHQPNGPYLGADTDTLESHGAALAYVDSQLPILLAALGRRGRSYAMVCSDHGTAYGEDGQHGHRTGHPVVWTVPFTEFLLPGDRR